MMQLKKFTNIAIYMKQNEIVIFNKAVELINSLDFLMNQSGENVLFYLDCNNIDIIKNSINLKNSNMIIDKINNHLDQIDLVVVIGGDGTLLSVSRIIANYDIPLIGINYGKLGFMTDIPANDMLTYIHDIIIKQQYIIDYRSILAATITSKQQNIYNKIALNDIVISRAAIGSMIEFDLSINDEFVLSQKSDGVIFATPTGSTAYSLAAGGAIMHPDANVISIVPICPQSLTNRPLIIGDTTIIHLKITKENATQIHFDGQESYELQYNDIITIYKHTKKTILLHHKTYSYYNTLRTKLDWSKRLS